MPKTATPTAAEQLLHEQSQFAATAQRIKKLKGLIEQQERLVADGDAKMPDLAALESERNALLADAAISNAESTDKAQVEQRAAQQSALAQIDQQISDEHARAKTLTSELADVKRTITGLRQKLAHEQDQNAALRASCARLMRAYLYGEAEAVGAEYAALAAEFEAKYKRIHGLNSLLQEHGHAEIISPQFHGVFLPTLNLPAFQARTGLTVPQALFVAPMYRGGTTGWRNAEEDALRTLGIQLTLQQEDVSESASAAGLV